MGTLSLSVTKSATNVDLTTLSADNWVQWDTDLTPTNSKSGGSGTITAAVIGGGSPSGYGGDPRTISWTDGTPTGSGSSDGGIYSSAGMQATFPADTTVREARLYVGYYDGSAGITVSISDSSTSPQTDNTTLTTNGGGASGDGYAVVSYSANSAGQTITIQVTTVTAANTTLQAAAVKVTGSGTSVALTGQSATSSGGIATPTTDKALTGQELTATGGTFTPATSKTLSGQSLTAAQGTTSPSVTIVLTGLQATFSQGTVTAGNDVTVALTGQSATLSQGVLSPSTDTALTGLSGLLSGGTIVPDASKSISGQASTLAGGTLSPESAITLTGQSATISQGTLTTSGGDITVALTGLQATFSQGVLAAPRLILDTHDAGRDRKTDRRLREEEKQFKEQRERLRNTIRQAIEGKPSLIPQLEKVADKGPEPLEDRVNEDELISQVKLWRQVMNSAQEQTKREMETAEDDREAEMLLL